MREAECWLVLLGMIWILDLTTLELFAAALPVECLTRSLSD